MFSFHNHSSLLWNPAIFWNASGIGLISILNFSRLREWGRYMHFFPMHSTFLRKMQAGPLSLMAPATCFILEEPNSYQGEKICFFVLRIFWSFSCPIHPASNPICKKAKVDCNWLPFGTWQFFPLGNLWFLLVPKDTRHQWGNEGHLAIPR